MNRQTRTMVLLALLASIVLGGWMLLRADRGDDWAEFPSPDAWYRGPTNAFIQDAEAKERNPASFAVVVSAKEAESLVRLERSPGVEVSEAEAAELAGRPLDGTGGRLVLLRALSWNTPHGGFAVSWRPGAVRVYYGCLGAQPLPVVRRAVIARLPDVPSEVFVDLGMAQ